MRAKKVRLEVELGNAAMLTLHDVNLAVSRSLAKFAMEHGFETVLGMGDGTTVVDENGNRVGQWEVVEA